ncbi:hypothetical protein COU37_02965 [Candidatus Micrarchaeota archaeon CG10_big_fil_rev_8_21_14_0_10_45_29]|nr:MAG: hypothetical protein COU37_02965 [Candidatus Micrarchaeota archaeon CG10_big_fil_rev_8_21_14_0_10_45_29]QBM01539.1 hypothetical protein [uncultured archaeon]
MEKNGGKLMATNLDFAVLLQRMTMWEERYREKMLNGKTEEQLKEEGWWRDIDGTWVSKKMMQSRKSYFREELGQLVKKYVGIPADFKSLKTARTQVWWQGKH